MRRALLVALAACGTETSLRLDATTDADDGSGELPCDVSAVLDNACAHCHSSPPSGDAPVPLLTRRDFFAASSTDGEHLGARTLARLSLAADPMPPRSEPPASPAQLAILETWIAAGMPAGSCGELPVKPIATTCASNDFWTGGDTPSDDMQPGMSCLGCHLEHGGSRAFFFSGTVFSGFHDKTLCNTPPTTGARIEILDTQGNVTLTLLPSPGGNFHSLATTANVPLPYRARLVANGLTREMMTPQMSGDCNACHTEQGSRQFATERLAPGRIVWPQPRP